MNNNNHSILYVEDDPLSREVIRLLLVNVMGFAPPVIFEDSTDFMARLQALPTKPTIILLDIHMLPHDGFVLLEMLRNHSAYRGATVVALTASVMSDEVKKLRTAGFDGVISKPINQRAFPELLGRILQGEAVWHVV